MFSQTRRWSLLSVTVLAGSALLAACGTEAEDGSSESPTNVGTGEMSTLELGVMFDMTGPFSVLGDIDDKALKLVLDDITSEASENGVEVNLQLEDSQSDPDKAVQLARQYVRDGVHAIIGPSPQGSCLATKPYLESEGVVQYCLSGGPFEWSPLFFSGAYPPEGALGGAPVRFFVSKGWEHVGCLAPSGPSGDAYAVPLEAAAAEAGLEFTLLQYPGDSNDVTPQLVMMREAGVDVVYSCSSGTGIVTVARGVTQLGWEVPVFAGQGSVNGDILDATKGFIPTAGVFSNGNYITLPEYMPEDDPRYEVVTSFAEAYQEEYGSPADDVGATFVDGLNLIVDAAIDLHGRGEEISGASLAGTLETVTDYPGILSYYNFSPESHRGSEPPDVVFEWTPAGEFELVVPE